MRTWHAAVVVGCILGGPALAQPGPVRSYDSEVSTASGARFAYRSRGAAGEWVGCDRGEVLVTAFCPPDGQHPLLRDDPAAPGGKVATCRRGPFTLVCAR